MKPDLCSVWHVLVAGALPLTALLALLVLVHVDLRFFDQEVGGHESVQTPRVEGRTAPVAANSSRWVEI